MYRGEVISNFDAALSIFNSRYIKTFFFFHKITTFFMSLRTNFIIVNSKL